MPMGLSRVHGKTLLKDEKPATPEPSAQSLDPAIKKAADAVYCQDPENFKNLIVWIRQAQKGAWSTDSIVKALRDFSPRAKTIARLEILLAREREHRMVCQVLHLTANKALREANRGIARLVRKVKRLQGEVKKS